MTSKTIHLSARLYNQLASIRSARTSGGKAPTFDAIIGELIAAPAGPDKGNATQQAIVILPSRRPKTYFANSRSTDPAIKRLAKISMPFAEVLNLACRHTGKTPATLALEALEASARHYAAACISSASRASTKSVKGRPKVVRTLGSADKRLDDAYTAMLAIGKVPTFNGLRKALPTNRSTVIRWIKATRPELSALLPAPIG